MFHYEVLKDPKKAIELADAALQQALDKIDELGEEEFRDAKSIIELLKENLTLWKEEEEGGNDIQDLWKQTRQWILVGLVWQWLHWLSIFNKTY